jgi:hypothetical protein
MAERKYKYTAKIKQPQTVDDVKIDPKGGEITERQYKTIQKDAYGISLLKCGLLIVKDVPVSGQDSSEKGAATETAPQGEIIHDFDEAGWTPPK